MDTDNAASLQSIDANIVKYQDLVAVEDDKMLRYKVGEIQTLCQQCFVKCGKHKMSNNLVIIIC